MNIVFLTISKMNSIEEHAIYTDLLREFRDKGHNVYVACANEKRTGKKTEYVEENGVHILRVKIGNITKCGMIEKGISTLKVEGQYIREIKKYFEDIKFDLVLYPTPPITFEKVVKYIKKRDKAKTYLLLKDIFPQNAVDIGMLSKRGVKGIIYRFFRKKEQRLYAISDKIGCMSQANCDYILKHNPTIPADKVEVCPNCIEPIDVSLNEEEKTLMRNKYGIPLDKKVFVYGGNLGKPQGISFLIDCLRSQKENSEVFFLIVGNGTEYKKLAEYYETEKPTHVKVMPSLPRDDYDRMIAACDVGMIFLDYRFTIPNFPSRLLSYMQAGLPIFACTDVNTDIGKVITDGGFGWWCESNDVTAFAKGIERAMVADCTAMGKQAQQYLAQEYSTAKGYEIIMESRQSGLK